MKPVIGITCDYDWEKETIQLKPGYVQGVCRAGGLPYLIPPVSGYNASDIIGKLDGLLLTGGQDVDPRFFGEQPHPAIGRINPYRDELELSLCREAAESGLPIFGICRGIQLINIAMGGDIFQDLGMAKGERELICHSQNAPKWHGVHEVKIKEGTKLHKILGTDLLYANSFHHQSVRRPAWPLEAVAHTQDGIIEAVESGQHMFFIGVQWHPECMLEDRYMQKLFDAFVSAAKNYRKTGGCG
ncbi:MAG TPA: gamma-glutamyl-gamma-aminobutyrate hydrolase family protein [Clostridiales bacterium]|nr:gamma-glutamyl-gamma-aminobutyrate hydrolase family protein [Clostridiales bacterium]